MLAWYLISTTSRYLLPPTLNTRSLPQMLATLLDAAECGPVFLGLPQDIQTYAFDFPKEMFGKRVWAIPRNRPDRAAISAAAEP